MKTMKRKKPKAEQVSLPDPWSVTVAALTGADLPQLPAIKGRVHQARQRTCDAQSSMVPHRLAAGCGAGWKRERP